MRPLGPTDVMFLWAERRHQPMHVGGLHLYTPPAGAGPDFVREMVTAVRKHAQAQPPYNQRARFRLGHWFWDEDRDFDIEYHVRHSALPRPGRIRELLSVVSRLHGNLMDRSRPLWEMHVIEGLADGRLAAYIKVHHALFDGMAAMRTLQSALSEDSEERKPPFWMLEVGPRRRPAPPPAEDGVEELSPGRLVRPLLGALRVGSEIVPGIGSGLWEIVRAAQDSPADAQPFHAPPTLFNVPISSSRRFAAKAYSLARLRAIGKATGATVNDVTLTVCSGALRRYLLANGALPDRPLIAMVPVSVRSDQEGGNQVAMLLANLATDVADPAERLRRVVESTRMAKERMSGMSRLERVAYAAAMGAPIGPSILTGHARKRPIFNVVISNVPGPRRPLYMNGLRLEETYPLSIPIDYLALNITISGYCDQLGFGYTACRRSVPALQRMLDHTDETLAELEAAVGTAAA